MESTGNRARTEASPTGRPTPGPEDPDVRGGKRGFVPTERKGGPTGPHHRTGHPETSVFRGTKAAGTACDTPAAVRNTNVYPIGGKVILIRF